MIGKVIKEIEKEDNRRIKEHGELWAISRWTRDLDDFYKYIFEYFELDKILKDKKHDDFSYPNEDDFYRQKHNYLIYLEEFLRDIKPYLLLAWKLSYDLDIDEKFKNQEIREDSIVNMIDNFVRLNRSGRKRKFYTLDSEDFQKFKEKYENVIEYLKEIKSEKVKSIRDFAIAVRNHNLSKDQLNKYRFEFNYWKRKCKDSSNSTIYRFDKDLIFLRKYYFYVKDALSKFDFYQDILKSDSLKEDQKS